MNIHFFENNEESQSRRNNNEEKFSNQCLKVLNLLKSGIKLTVLNSHGYGVMSLPRRIKDLRDKNGITNIKDHWLKDDEGKNLMKEWYWHDPSWPIQGKLFEA